MTDKLYYKLWQDAQEQPDKELYLSEYGYPDWFDEIDPDPERVLAVLGRIHDIIWTPFKDVVSASGLSQQKFGDRFCIPLRTIQSWCEDVRKAPAWTKKLIIEKLEADGVKIL